MNNKNNLVAAQILKKLTSKDLEQGNILHDKRLVKFTTEKAANVSHLFLNK